MNMNEKTNYSLDFRVVHGSVEDTFESMKKCMELGLADRSATITFNGICLPAGYYDEVSDYFSLYSSVINLDVPSVIESLPEDISPLEAERTLSLCSEQMQDFGVVISHLDISRIVEERYSPNVKKK